jgi:hypothetical protein
MNYWVFDWLFVQQAGRHVMMLGAMLAILSVAAIVALIRTPQ